MAFTLLCAYVFGWVITTIGLAVIFGKLNDPVRLQRLPIPLTVVAGAVWPLVILGAVQMAILALVMEATRRCTSRSRRSATPTHQTGARGDRRRAQRSHGKRRSSESAWWRAEPLPGQRRAAAGAEPCLPGG
jgi:hypothetical protein